MTVPWYRVAVDVAAAKVSLDPNLVEAVVLQESAGRAAAYRFEPAFWERYMKDDPKWFGMEPRRVSASYGLMQVMYPVAVEHGFTQDPEYLFVPSIGLEYGTVLLAELVLWARGDVRKALGAYNGGRGGWDRPIPQHYATSVMSFYNTVL